ncbi:isocitrate/isopropylmalate family dehydrogenase [Streptomyces shenzhenensis]|uniref:isocitrate/isopropylmalate family dehydrogenase n=1 Tax=Streptomyces shenzhenensis TaxID=943815 RepID=UPI003D8C00A7
MAALSLVRDPKPYEGVLAPNLFGDIISDIGAALMGRLGLAPSASICPETGFALCEPVHGSAPDAYGKAATPDLGGTGTTRQFAAEVTDLIDRRLTTAGGVPRP